MSDHDITHRGIAITRHEVPGASFTWTHDEADMCGEAETIIEAKRQIDRHLGADEEKRIGRMKWGR